MEGEIQSGFSGIPFEDQSHIVDFYSPIWIKSKTNLTVDMILSYLNRSVCQ